MLNKRSGPAVILFFLWPWCSQLLSVITVSSNKMLIHQLSVNDGIVMSRPSVQSVSGVAEVCYATNTGSYHVIMATGRHKKQEHILNLVSIVSLTGKNQARRQIFNLPAESFIVYEGHS